MKDFLNLQNALDLDHIAAVFDLDVCSFKRIYSNRKYQKVNIPKKDGSFREICIPNDELKFIQRKLYKIFSKIKVNTSLSHGFEKNKSTITNAKIHLKKKNILNIDLENFFDSFNFGRVRGFLVKNREFQFKSYSATIVANIICHENKLPQGSPCSPIMANLIANILDIRLNKFLKLNGCSYSRYADDITISTNKKKFPESILIVEDTPKLGSELLEIINNAGFTINNNKTRLQNKLLRQDVTGLVVNDKIGVKTEYRKQTRAMVDCFIKKEKFFIDGSESHDIKILEGRLNYIDLIDRYNNCIKKKNVKHGNSANSIYEYMNSREKVYSDFLFFKYFAHSKIPVMLTEGNTDIIYLKCALEYFKKKNKKIELDFIRRTKKNEFFLGIDKNGGTGTLLKFICNYKKWHSKLRVTKNNSPAIILLDNDSGADKIINYIAGEKKVSNDEIRNLKFVNIFKNLYLILTPKNTDNTSKIEDFFDSSVLRTVIEGKKFTCDNTFDKNIYYGKTKFAYKVVKRGKGNISFEKFKYIFDQIKLICEDWKSRE